MPFANSTVKQLNGVPVLHINGEPIHGMTATSCAFDDPAVVRDFTASGVEIMMIWIEIGVNCWKGEGKYDWTYAEKKLRFFAEHSGDTRWIIRIRLGLLARWWAEEHPSEVHNPPGKNDGADSKLSVANIVSPVWLEGVITLVRAFVAWLKDSEWAPRVIGFMLNAGATEEWLPFDVNETARGVYHPVYQREFRVWLRKHYGNDAAKFRAAWTSPDYGAGENITFETASCPGGLMRKGSHIWGPFSLRDPAREQAAIDYYLFLNETLADSLIAICHAAKEAAQTPVICGGFHSYLWWESGACSYIQEYGHGLIQRLNESPWVDFVSDIASYDCRYPGGPSGYLGLPHSLNLHGKLHYTEVDLRTPAALPQKWRDAWAAASDDAKAAVPVRRSAPIIPDMVWNWNCGCCGRDMPEQIALLQREHYHNLVTGTPYWWFDIGSHHYQAPELIDALAKLSAIGRQAVAWDRRGVAEVAFICSEDTPMRQAAMNGELLRFEKESEHPLLLDLCAREWGLAGVPYDTYELHDLAHPDFPGDRYKLLIYVNCACVSPAAAAGVRRWQNAGRVHLWTHAADVYHDRAIAPALSESTTGIRLGWRNERRNIRVIPDASSSHPLCENAAALAFGTEGSLGPVFFADDPRALTLGTLRDTGEPAFALREHAGWRSLYLSMHNFGAELFRNIARFAGAHIWSDTNDVIYANRSLLCLHTATAGAKIISLPAPAFVTDLQTGIRSSAPVGEIRLDALRFRTYAWKCDNWPLKLASRN